MYQAGDGQLLPHQTELAKSHSHFAFNTTRPAGCSNHSLQGSSFEYFNTTCSIKYRSYHKESTPCPNHKQYLWSLQPSQQRAKGNCCTGRQCRRHPPQSHIAVSQHIAEEHWDTLIYHKPTVLYKGPSAPQLYRSKYSSIPGFQLARTSSVYSDESLVDPINKRPTWVDTSRPCRNWQHRLAGG